MVNWTKIRRPILGLSPMDGITDVAFRELVDGIGKPSVLFTEFVPAGGVARRAPRIMRSLQKHKTQTPIVAQLFGDDPKEFYRATQVICKLGFDGVDINMGCPDRNINKKGGGAALIAKPDLALNIIKSVKASVEDFSSQTSKTSPIPVSVKTRIGLEKPITAAWITRLIEAKPDAIILHGRTFVQMYRGQADWKQISLASQISHSSQIPLIGNGDIKSRMQAYEYSDKYGTDGVLIGRAALGNPWVFSDKNPDHNERLRTMIQHCKLFLKYRDELKLYPMRKHLAWYIQGFSGAAKMRNELMRVVSLQDVISVLDTQH